MENAPDRRAVAARASTTATIATSVALLVACTATTAPAPVRTESSPPAVQAEVYSGETSIAGAVTLLPGSRVTGHSSNGDVPQVFTDDHQRRVSFRDDHEGCPDLHVSAAMTATTLTIDEQVSADRHRACIPGFLVTVTLHQALGDRGVRLVVHLSRPSGATG